MLVSGFVDGKLIYIIEFPFKSHDFIKNLKNKINNWKSKMKGSRTTKGQFLRSADFDYKDYIKSPDLKIIYLLSKSELKKYKDYMVKGFFEFLWSKAR